MKKFNDSFPNIYLPGDSRHILYIYIYKIYVLSSTFRPAFTNSNHLMAERQLAGLNSSLNSSMVMGRFGLPSLESEPFKSLPNAVFLGDSAHRHRSASRFVVGEALLHTNAHTYTHKYLWRFWFKGSNGMLVWSSAALFIFLESLRSTLLECIFVWLVRKIMLGYR